MKRLFFLFLMLSSVSCIAGEPKDWQIGFQTPSSPIMHHLQDFHNLLLIIISAISTVVLGLLVYVAIRFNKKANPIPSKFSDNLTIEIIWTVIPVIILIFIFIPSAKITRIDAKIPKTELTIKVVGYQWYWHYEYPGQDGIEFDSYMLQKSELRPGQKRLLDVDNRLFIPENTYVKFLITAGDVMHSFAVPSLGIKTDAVPGRVNETWTKVEKSGVYYGQCSELCGPLHGFMPIAIEVVSKEKFDAWISSQKRKITKT